MTQQSSSSRQPSAATATSGTITNQAKDTVGQIGEQAQQTAGQVVDQARQQVSSRLAGQKDRAAEGLTSVAQALRQTSQQLRTQDQQTVTGYIESAASQVERVSNYLKQNDLGGMIDDVEHFARRQPALFLGGTFVLGLLGARFLKSSRPNTGVGRSYYGSTALAQRQPGYQGGSGTSFSDMGASTGTSMRPGSSQTMGRTTSTQSYSSGNGPRSYDYRPEE